MGSKGVGGCRRGSVSQKKYRGRCLVLLGLIPGLESDGGYPRGRLGYATLVHVDGDPLGTVRGLLRGARDLGFPAGDAPSGAAVLAVLTALVVTVLAVEGLQGEAPVRLLASTATLRYMRVVLTHCLRLVYLQLSVESLQLRLTTSQQHRLLEVHQE